MKKIVKTLLLILVIFIGISLFSKVNAASARITGPASVEVGSNANVTITINAAAWNLKVSGDGVSGASFVDNTDDARNQTITKTVKLDTSSIGDKTIRLTGDVTDGNTDATTPVNTSVTVKVIEKKPTPTPTPSTSSGTTTPTPKQTSTATVKPTKSPSATPKSSSSPTPTTTTTTTPTPTEEQNIIEEEIIDNTDDTNTIDVEGYIDPALFTTSDTESTNDEPSFWDRKGPAIILSTCSIAQSLIAIYFAIKAYKIR